MARGDGGNIRTQADSDPCPNILAVDYSGGDVTFDQPVCIRCNVAGDLKVDGYQSGTETLTLIAGETPPIVISKVYKTGSTATVHAIW